MALLVVLAVVFLGLRAARAETALPGITVAGATDDLSVDIRSGPGSDAAPWVLPPGAGAGIASAEVRAMLTRLLGGEDGA